MTRCNLCLQATVEVLLDFGDQPIAHRYLATPDELEYTHPMRLGFCHSCGLSQMVDPVPPSQLYTQYNWLSSWKWNPHLGELLDTIERLPGLTKSSKLLEIGSNDGSFLEELRDRGFSNLVGLEPADDASAASIERGIATVHDYFTRDVAQGIVEEFGYPDLIVARHVLEHVADLPTFAISLREALQPGAYLLIEVPDFEFHQRAIDYSGMWEEHVNQFTAETLARFFADVGIPVESVESLEFNGKALVAYGRYSAEAPRVHVQAGADLAARAFLYRDAWPGFAAEMREYLGSQKSAGKRVGVYGIGRRAIVLINVCDVADCIEFAVDDQSERQGKYVAGSHLPIHSTDVLLNGELDVCLLGVNAENEDSVTGKLREFVQHGGEFVSILPPSPRLPEFWKEMTRCAPVS